MNQLCSNSKLCCTTSKLQVKKNSFTIGKRNCRNSNTHKGCLDDCHLYIVIHNCKLQTMHFAALSGYFLCVQHYCIYITFKGLKKCLPCFQNRPCASCCLTLKHRLKWLCINPAVHTPVRTLAAREENWWHSLTLCLMSERGRIGSIIFLLWNYIFCVPVSLSHSWLTTLPFPPFPLPFSFNQNHLWAAQRQAVKAMSYRNHWFQGKLAATSPTQSTLWFDLFSRL